MATTQDKYRKLLEILYSKTIDGKLTWNVDEWNDPFTRVGAKAIFLESSEGDDGQPLILLKILDPGGNVVETFNDEQVDGTPSIGGMRSFFELMKTVRAQAIRQATGADHALDELLSELGEVPPF